MDQEISSDFASSLMKWEDDNDGDASVFIGQKQCEASHETMQPEILGEMCSETSSAFTSTASSLNPVGRNAITTNGSLGDQTDALERLQAFQMANIRANQVQAATQSDAGPSAPMYAATQQVLVHHQAPYGYVQLPQHLIHQQLSFNHQAAVASGAHQQQVPAFLPQQYAALASTHHQSPSVVSASTSSSNSTITSSTTTSHGAITSSSATPRSLYAENKQHHGAPHLHPLAMQASSTCPTHVHGTLPSMHFNMYPNVLQGSPILPFMFNPLLQAGVVASNPQLNALFQAQQQAQMQHVAQQQQHCVAPAPSTSAPPPIVPVNEPTPTTSATQKTKTAKPLSIVAEPTGGVVPPFMLFDAPVELRTNFLASQRMHNLPLYHDCNTVHYGMAVNGFHPQLNAQINPVTSISSSLSLYSPGTVRLIDGRSNKPKMGRERNEREQKRAQKITELIDALRVSMEKGGWKVEMKSKYHTLSTCADYVKHLIETTQNKEEAVEQAKGDLAMSERKLEEKILEQSRSEPESVTSSLTASTKAMEKDQLARSRRKRKVTTDAEDRAVVGKAKDSESSAEESSSGDDRGNGSGPGGHNISLNKMSSSISDVTDSNRGSSDSGGDRKTKRRKRRQKDAEGRNEDDNSQPNSSISSTAAVARGESANVGDHGRSDVVIKIKKAKKIKVDARKKEITSLSSNFALDYEEVFVASNIPQLLATPSGRVITTNDFFLKATGLTKQGASRLTIFSIVKPDKLSNLFQIVAEALRQDTTESEQCSNKHETGSFSSDGQSSGHTSRVSSSNEGNGSETWNNNTITLPCITFPSRGERKDVALTHHPNPLYMTVTLMRDPDPGKRCFHCALTDCPGTGGQSGFITPELLELLFSETIEEEPHTDASSGSDPDGCGESNDTDDIAVKEEHDLGMMMDD